ncbi:MAG: DUF444 family protein [Moorellales bacterium]
MEEAWPGLTFDPWRTPWAGQGGGGTRKGEVLGVVLPDGPGPPGSLPGEEVFDQEWEAEEEALSPLLMGLELDCRRQTETPSPVGEAWEIVGRGPKGGLDRRRTLQTHLRRRAREGRKGPGPLAVGDLRFRRPQDDPESGPGGVWLAAADCSGSVGRPERRLIRLFFWWWLRWLRHCCPRAETVFILHHTQARMVTEAEFFARAGSGGTRCSSAYRLARQILEAGYRDQTERYLVHLSDGDNLPSDNPECLELIRALLAQGVSVAYGEVGERLTGRPGLGRLYGELKAAGLILFPLRRPADVYPAVRCLALAASRVEARRFELGPGA